MKMASQSHYFPYFHFITEKPHHSIFRYLVIVLNFL